MVSATLVTSACSSPGAGDTSAASGGAIAVVASTDVWGSVAKAIGGGAVEVTSIIHNPAEDPHDYQTSARDTAAIKRAQLTVANGDGYDEFFTKAAAGRAENTSVVAFSLSSVPHTPEANEHFFYDLPTVRKVAEKIATDLGRLRPAAAAAFTAHARTFDAKLQALQAKAKQIGVAHPGKRVVVTEPVAGYLLHTAGVPDVTPKEFSGAVEKGTGIPAAALAQMSGLIERNMVNALINNAQAETAVTTKLQGAAARAGIPVVNVTETLPKGSKGYIPWMSKQINDLSGALSR
ncbi:MAG: metal ABC transporter solute-binding protein, Zn/Mn family [Sciscionella sp.]